MEPRIDERVLEVQIWLNTTYGNDSRFNRVEENGKTGWNVIYGLRRALQIELGIQETSNSFGPTTYSKCPTIAQGAEGNLVRIVQGGLWCKGYNPGGFGDYYGNGTYAAVKALKTDAGFPSASGNMQRDFMRALLDMSAFVCIYGGSEAIRSVQQQLNYDYYDYYQICPCDGLYNRDMNKMLTYALQKELGIAKASATGAWGPTTISLCKAKTFSIGDSDPIIKLARYAVVCNGFTVSTSSSTYDSSLDSIISGFCKNLMVSKPSGKINYTVIKSLLSSNGDTDRSAVGCDTATKLTQAQINTIKENGYKFVGRYISNTPGGTLNKALTRTEIESILNSGLKLFYIFQESNNSVTDFSPSNALAQANRALQAIYKLGIPNKATIFFAVDCDPQQGEIAAYILNYFRNIFAVFDKANGQYNIGVYGTRNVCLNLRKEFGQYIKLFVSDASYGFSGNLGFAMPTNWAFDQFKTDITIGSGEGKVSIDKVAVSYLDNCNYGSLIPIDEEDDTDDSIYDFYYPNGTETVKQGCLMVNMNDRGLNVYKCIRMESNDEFFHDPYAVALPKTRDLKYTLPKNAFYLDIGRTQNELDSNNYMTSHLIKYLDESGGIQFGFIPVAREFLYGDAPIETFPNKLVAQDIAEYDLQQDYLNYIVNDAHNALIPSSRISIEGRSCVVYKLNKDVSVYNPDGTLSGKILKDTEIALNENRTGVTKNQLFQVFRKKQGNQWISTLQNPQGSGIGYMEYLLEEGCMPLDRVINN